MTYQETNHGYLIKLERGESLFSELEQFCRDNGIRSAIFNAIGAVNDVTMGYYDLNEREYFFTEYPEDMEVASMHGNVVRLSADGGEAKGEETDEPFIHVHGVLTGTDNRAIGGHIKEAKVAVTLEVVLQDLGKDITRKYDDAIGLKLLDL